LTGYHERIVTRVDHHRLIVTHEFAHLVSAQFRSSTSCT
jgi:hypothetical protein